VVSIQQVQKAFNDLKEECVNAQKGKKNYSQLIKSELNVEPILNALVDRKVKVQMNQPDKINKIFALAEIQEMEDSERATCIVAALHAIEILKQMFAA
jgi:hypothetical protein